VDYGEVRDEVDLVVPVKTLDRAKTRLTSATGGDPVSHAALALALALDTVSAAVATPGVRRVVTITSDPAVAAEMAALGVESLPEPAQPGLNAALEHGARTLRSSRIGALQADLPALKPDELQAALEAARGRRAFVPDRQGTGTTLLLAAPGGELDPRFGIGSAGLHRLSGAVALIGAWPSLRCDVDTEEDLRLALALGLGTRTANALPAWTT
jgi:2-phospho-L-lactate guanylyltransferase